jgi:hypothetical protein
MPPPRRSRGWIPFFLVVLVLALAASVTLVVYNFKQQLKPEQLEAAWKLWKHKGPASYLLVYSVRKGEDQELERFEVRVRGGTTESVTLNGNQVERRVYPYYGMDELFGQISEFLRKDAEPGKPRVYTRAMFDDKDGHLLWYVRRVMGTRERLEIAVEALQPLS